MLIPNEFYQVFTFNFKTLVNISSKITSNTMEVSFSDFPEIWHLFYVPFSALRVEMKMVEMIFKRVKVKFSDFDKNLYTGSTVKSVIS